MPNDNPLPDEERSAEYLEGFKAGLRLATKELDEMFSELLTVGRLLILLNQSLRSLELPVRTKQCLNAGEIHTLGDLLPLTDAELLVKVGSDQALLNEIDTALRGLGLKRFQASGL